MSSVMPSRRTVVRTTAWSVPAITIATAAPAFATSHDVEPTYQTVEKTFVYEATIGQVTVKVNAVVPLTAPVGSILNPTQTTSTVTIPDSTRSILGPFILGNPAFVDGTSKSVSDLEGVLATTTTSNLTIPRTPFPTSGDLVTVASGVSDSPMQVPAGTSLGTVVIKMGRPESILYGYNANGTPNGKEFKSTLNKITSQDYTLATFQVVAGKA